MKRRNTIIILFTLSILIAFSCRKIFSLGFLNDEWIQLGYVRGAGIFAGYINTLSLMDILMGKGRFIGGMINNAFLYAFESNPAPFIIFALVFHLINSYLVYRVVKKLTRKESIAFISACVFSVPAGAHQAISWLAATVQTVGGMTFILLSILSAIDGIQKKRLSTQILSWIFAYIAFLFKESSFFIFPLLLIIPYVLGERITIKRARMMALMFSVLLFIGIYKSVLFLGYGMRNIPIQNIMSVFGKPLVNMALYPLLSLIQFFVPFRFMLRFSLAFSGYFYSFLAGADESNRAASVVAADMLSVIFSILVIVAASIVYSRRKYLRRCILFLSCWYVLSFVPIAFFLPERNTSYLESRYLYFSYVPMAVLISAVLVEIKIWLSKILRSVAIAWTITIVLLSVYLYKQGTFIHREIFQNSVYSSEAATAMSLVRSMYPILPEKPIFLVEGDKTFYYAFINLPFQEGIGYMLALLFRDSPVIPKELLAKGFLSKHESQGYAEEGKKGFGYFGNRTDLVSLFHQRPDLSTGQIVSMYYFGFKGTLIDTTGSVREFVRINR